MNIRIRNESDSEREDNDRDEADEPLFRTTSSNVNGSDDDSEEEQVRQRALAEHLAGSQIIQKESVNDMRGSAGERGSGEMTFDEKRNKLAAGAEKKSGEKEALGRMKSSGDKLEKKSERAVPLKVESRKFESSDDDDLRQQSKKSTSKKRAHVSSDDDDVRTRPAETSAVVFRSKSGAKISKEEFMQERALNGHKKKIEKVKRERLTEKQLPWGGGLAQKRQKEAEAEAAREIANEPVARFDIAESLDRQMKEDERWDDPLAAMKRLEGVTTKVKREGFPAPPNRFNIKPGKRWDGRVRGNGFEERYLAALSGSLSKPTMAMYSAMD